MTPTLTDYLTGEPIRPATREEWQRSADAARTGDGTGAFTLDGRAVFVAGDFPTTGHTPEPWSFVEDGGGSAFSFEIRADQRGNGGQIRGIALVYADNPDDGSPGTEDTANATRIVACVNALAGVRDPDEAIRQARHRINDVLNHLLDNCDGRDPASNDYIAAGELRTALALLEGAK